MVFYTSNEYDVGTEHDKRLLNELIQDSQNLKYSWCWEKQYHFLYVVHYFLSTMFWGIFLRFTWASQICGMRKAAFCRSHLYREILIFILCVCFGLQFPFDFYELHLENLDSVFKISTLRQVVPHAAMLSCSVTKKVVDKVCKNLSNIIYHHKNHIRVEKTHTARFWVPSLWHK